MKSIRMFLLAAAVAMPTLAVASGGVAPPAQSWEFAGMFGKFDTASLKRGVQVATGVCLSCHSIKYIKYDQLKQIGLTEAEIKSFADAQGATKKDRLKAPMDDQTAKDTFGIVPPDLSLITKARKGFEDYTFAILTGYLKDDEAKKVSEANKDGKLSDEEITELGHIFHIYHKDTKKMRDDVTMAVERIAKGENFNKYFPGNFFAMPQPLTDGQVDYTDGTKASLDQMAKDVVTFLAWAAEPTLMERHAVGHKVMIYLVILTVMLYALKRRIWARIHH